MNAPSRMDKSKFEFLAEFALKLPVVWEPVIINPRALNSWSILTLKTGWRRSYNAITGGLYVRHYWTYRRKMGLSEFGYVTFIDQIVCKISHLIGYGSKISQIKNDFKINVIDVARGMHHDDGSAAVVFAVAKINNPGGFNAQCGYHNQFLSVGDSMPPSETDAGGTSSSARKGGAPE
jgi:hypothetical protein